jgi:hypothetical protein
VVARVNEAVVAPLSKCLTSGSFPTLPISITLLSDISFLILNDLLRYKYYAKHENKSGIWNLIFAVWLKMPILGV